MKIITDSASNLSQEQAQALGVTIVPFHLTFMGQNYRDGVDLIPSRLYQLYNEHPAEYTTTSTPSMGDYLTAYDDCGSEEILSIHLSSGLSGAYASARSAAHLAANKAISVIDTRTVGPALGWIVETAARCAQAGWSKERILTAIEDVRRNTFTMVAFTDLKYLLESGRVSHLTGIVASLLKLKPIIGMNEVDGRYRTIGQERTERNVCRKMANVLQQHYTDQKLHLQLMHGTNLPCVEQLRDALTSTLTTFTEDAVVAVTTVLGAHAGPTVFGLAAMPESVHQKYL